MTLPGEPTTRGRALLLSRAPGWTDAVTAAAARVGLDLEVTGSATEALVLLAGVHGVCRFLLDEEAAGWATTALLEMTSGEVDSGVDVIWLGPNEPGLGLQGVPVPDVDALAQALAHPDPFPFEWMGQPPLEPAQILHMMEAGHVHVRFQPIVNVRDRSLVALEVLARLHRTNCSILPPHRFIPQLEQAGFGSELLKHVTEAAFSVENVLDGARMALNLPLNLLNDRLTVKMLAALRERAGVSAFRVLIELTETQVVEDVAKLNPVVGHWREAGYALAIDDAGPEVPRHRDMFGLPFDWVKLDKAVVREAVHSPAARRYMADTVASAHLQDLAVIAEGIENQETWDMLLDLGVDCGQGFLIGRPLPADVVPIWRTAWNAGGIAVDQFPS